jgi:hypothetical protein
MLQPFSEGHSHCRRGHSLYAQLAHQKPRLVDTGGLCSGSQHIGLRRYVVWGCYPLGFVEEAVTCQHNQTLSQQTEAYYGAESIK